MKSCNPMSSSQWKLCECIAGLVQNSVGTYNIGSWLGFRYKGTDAYESADVYLSPSDTWVGGKRCIRNFLESYGVPSDEIHFSTIDDCTSLSFPYHICAHFFSAYKLLKECFPPKRMWNSELDFFSSSI